MSDGRVNKVDNNKIFDENYQKVIKVNNKAILAVGGNYKVSKVLLSRVNEFDTKNAKTLARSLFNGLGNGVVNNQMIIFVGGLDENENIYYTGFDQTSTNLDEYNPPNGSIYRFASESGEQMGMSNFDKLDQLINGLQQITLEEAKSIQEKLNTTVTEFDKTVGKKTFHEFIIKN